MQKNKAGWSVTVAERANTYAVGPEAIGDVSCQLGMRTVTIQYGINGFIVRLPYPCR